MARIQLLKGTSFGVGAHSQSIILPFLSDTRLQGYNLTIEVNGGGGEDVTNSTTMFLYGEYDSGEYKYYYNVIYDLPKNATESVKVIECLLSLEFEDDTIEQPFTITQRVNTRASSVSNITVLDEDGNTLEKDMYNRWIIPNSYPEGSRFTIKYNCSYPAEPSKLIDTSRGAFTTGNGFIKQCWTQTMGESIVEINDVTSAKDIDSVHLEYDDNWGIGTALTYIVFVRRGIEPIRIKTTPSQMVNVDHSGGHYYIEVEYSNIKFHQLNIENDSSWLYATWASADKIRVSITKNEDITSAARSANIKIYGTNDDGIYTETIVPISQVAMDIPYIGDAVETTEDYSGDIIPAIRTDYKGNVINNTGVLTFFNTKDVDGDDVIENVTILIDDEPTDFIRIEDIPSSRNSKIIANDIYKYNYRSQEVRNFIDINVDLVSGLNLNYRIAIIIEASPEHVVAPIWKDVVYESPKNYFRFKDVTTGDLLYNGMIYPDADNKIKINSILSTYIDINKYPFSKDINPNKCMIEAILEISDTPDFAYYDEASIYHLYWNYSYDYNAPHKMMSDFTSGYEGLHSGIEIYSNFANPIEYYDPRQYVFISYEVPFDEYNDVNSQVYGVYNEGGREELVVISKDTIKGDITTMAVRPGDFDEIEFHIDAEPGEDEDKDYLWKVGRSKCTRAKYAVYYLNSYGIWCWMLFEGKQMESIKTTANKYLNNNTNVLSYNIHNAVYQNNLEETYNLTSLHLKDDQSEKLKDLYTSPLIFVHELDTDVIYNVYLNNTTYDIKKFHNQGRKFFTHTIKLVKSINKSIIV